MIPKVSILVPVFGVENFIERCARSLFEQTYSNLEFIFVNDVTTDGSINILKEVINGYPELHENIKIIEHKMNRGLAAARNTGLELATGDFVVFVDSDDYIDTNAISIAVDATLKENADIVVWGVIYEFSDGTQKIRMSNPVPADKNIYFKNLISRDNHVNVWGNLFKTSIFKDNGVRFIEGLNFGEDFVTTPRIVYFCDKIVDLTSRRLYIYNQGNPSSYIAKGLSQQSYASILRSVSVLTSFIETHQFSIPQEDLIARLKVRTKVYLLEYCDKSIFKDIIKTYPEVCEKTIDMPLKHRFVWDLYHNGNIQLLQLYLRISKYVKKIFKV